jgi:hypothetical protein
MDLISDQLSTPSRPPLFGGGGTGSARRIVPVCVSLATAAAAAAIIRPAPLVVHDADDGQARLRWWRVVLVGLISGAMTFGLQSRFPN